MVTVASCNKEDDTVEPAPASTQTPVSYSVDKIVLTDFNMSNGSNQPWDALPNVGPDPFVQIVNNGTVIYKSTPAGNVTTSGPHDLSTASVGSLPITLNYDTPTTVELWEDDGGGFMEFIGSAVIQGSYVYTNDNASQYNDVRIVGTNEIKMELSGTFNY